MSKKVYSKPTITVVVMSTSPLLAAVSGGQYDNRKRVRDASIYASKKISLKFLFLSDIFLFPPIRQQVPILA